MRFGSNHAWQLAPGLSETEVWANEVERIQLAEAIGFDSVWVPEQHFFDYCGCPDALTMATWIAATTERVRVGTAVVNLTLTDPLRFTERAAMLDRLSGGRADICVGRGYQWPQNEVFGVAEVDTKPMFEESLDIILGSWTERPFAYDGSYWSFPAARTFPTPVRPAEEVLVHAVGGTTTPADLVRRGLPLALAIPFLPVERSASSFRAYATAVAESDLNAELMLDRSLVLIYALLAPTKEEARDLQRKPYEWHMARLAALSDPLDEDETWESISSSDPTPMADERYDAMCETSLFFDDVDSFCEKLAVLRDAGVRQVVPWMGAGGVSQADVLRSMQLLAEEVMPRFR